MIRTNGILLRSRMAYDRRSFLTTLAAAGALRTASVSAEASQTPNRPQTWDLSWLDQLKGRHKQLFDVGNMDIADDTPLRIPMNYFDTWRDVFQMQPPDVNVVIGVARGAFPMNASDALWEKYQLGEKWGIKDPKTRAIATRNIFLGKTSGGPGETVRALQARGAVFWQCNVALGAVAFQLANATGKPFADVRSELVAGLNPGVKLVPAHTLLVGMAQERGFTYEKP